MTKIQALEKTIYNLENDVYEYKWNDSNNCNCGVLAKTILGTSKSVFEHGYETHGKHNRVGVFSRNFHYCKTSGLKLPEIFKALDDCGFSTDELTELEFLGNVKIGAKIGLVVNEYCGITAAHGCYSNKNILIQYLKAWVDILKECEVKEPPQPEPTPVKVIHHYHAIEVPESIKASVPVWREN